MAKATKGESAEKAYKPSDIVFVMDDRPRESRAQAKPQRMTYAAYQGIADETLLVGRERVKRYRLVNAKGE